MDLLSTYHLKKWVADNQDYFNPPFRTNRLLVHHKDFLVMVLRGPNTRLDFHIEPGDEFFYQVEGDMELHLNHLDIIQLQINQFSLSLSLSGSLLCS